MAVGALELARERFHQDLADSVLAVRGETSLRGRTVPIYSNADRHSDLSLYLAAGIAELLPPSTGEGGTGTAVGSAFERAVARFLETSLAAFAHLGSWPLHVGTGRVISAFAQYEHLDDLQAAIKADPELEAAIGGDYLVRPDIVIFRQPLTIAQLDPDRTVMGEQTAYRTAVWTDAAAPSKDLLHATVSCKWTIRSDRVQNTRTEALNLVRNRKGRTPHIAAVTMEPLPNRLASIAIGTGDIDCVYHGALDELLRAAEMGAESFGGAWSAASARLSMMVSSSRLRDISDLPLDLLL